MTMTRRNSIATLITALLLCCQQCSCFSTTKSNNANANSSALDRREALNNMFRGITTAAAAAAVVVTLPNSPASALDFDAFESSLISNDSFKPEVSDDEALCKFGAPGKAMGEACERAGIQRKIPGGVDANGKVDRGDYLKCKYEYPKDKNGEFVKTRVCKPSSEWAP